MIEGTFDVAIDTPKLHRRGTLALKSEGERIAARLVVGEHDPLVFVGTCSDKEFDFAGEGELFGLGRIAYKAHGSTWASSIDIECQTDIGKIEIFGTRLSSTAGDFKSSHEYLMAAASGDFSDESVMYSGLYADGG